MHARVRACTCVRVCVCAFVSVCLSVCACIYAVYSSLATRYAIISDSDEVDALFMCSYVVYWGLHICKHTHTVQAHNQYIAMAGI